MAGKMFVKLDGHISKKNTLISIYYQMIPFILFFKLVASAFIWIVTPKETFEDNEGSNSSIAVGEND